MFSFFKKPERLVGVDIGAAAIKFVELDLGRSTPRLRRSGIVTLKGDVFANNTLTKPDRVVPEILRWCESDKETRAVTAVPAPSVFVKKIKVPRSTGAALAASIQLEASNLIPHKLEAVRLDYQIVGAPSRDQIEVILVAVKRDVLDSFIGCLNGAGLETAIVDVDLFALQNAFEFAYPERRSGTVALLNVGARYTSLNICREGRSLLSGDLSIGGRACTESIMQKLAIGFEEAESRKVCPIDDERSGATGEAIARWVDTATLEINRQLGLLWSSAASGGRIDSIMVSGGASLTPGFLEALSKRTELPCEKLDPFRGLELADISTGDVAFPQVASLGVALGLALRQVGDKASAEAGV